MSIRLLDAATLRLKVFTTEQKPPYAILSHTWVADDEIDFQEMTRMVHDPDHPASHKSGYKKIVQTCKKAKSHGYQYVWVDTCCIDKTSSAELSEAINSMFKWYKAAEVCYVWLSDLPPGQGAGIVDCRWFTRGWCLQELIAPNDVRFYDQSWGFIGSKSKLKDAISSITGIDRAVLASLAVMLHLPVARRMSWASRRVTTRTEDAAYCLLGILDVNMPMLYGEGEKAFIRLQEEIIKSSNDLSIFFPSSALEGRQDSLERRPDPFQGTGRTNFDSSESEESGLRIVKHVSEEGRETFAYRDLFARSPKAFAHCGEVIHASLDLLQTQTFSLTNSGIHFTNVGLDLITVDENCKLFSLPLHCFKSRRAKKPCEIILRKVGPGRFVRLRHCWHRLRRYERLPGAETEADEGNLTISEEVYIISKITPVIRRQLDFSHDYSIQFPKYLGDCLQGVTPRDRWDRATSGFLAQGDESFEGYAKVFPYLMGIPLSVEEDEEKIMRSGYFYLACGIETGQPPKVWTNLYSSKDWESLEEKYGEMVGLKYLHKDSRVPRDNSFQVGNILFEARVREDHSRGYPAFMVDISIQTLKASGSWRRAR